MEMASASGYGHRQARTMAALGALQLLIAVCRCGGAGTSASAPAPAASVPAVIVFGDSTVDTGNNNVIGTVLKSNFPPYGRELGRATGRFCNGRLPPDFISEALGLPPLVPAYLDPAYGIQDFARGVCFASAGTGLDNATAGVLGTCTVLSIWSFGGTSDSSKLAAMEFSGMSEHWEKIPKAMHDCKWQQVVKTFFYHGYEGEVENGRGKASLCSVAGCNAGIKSVIPLWKEVVYFKEYRRRLRRYAGRAKAKHIVSNALYIVSIGTNDFLENYFLFVTGRFKEFTVDEFQDFLIAQAEDFLAKIYRLGARRVTFAGLSPIGCLPLERTLNTLRGGCIEEYNQVAREYNVKVKAMIGRLCASLPGLKIAYVPVYDNMLNLINNPSTLGLENVEEGCCATGKFEMGYLCNDKSPLTCEDADKYFFWDSFHPTEKVNQFFAKSTLEICLRELL